jgi:hypothetical protein
MLDNPAGSSSPVSQCPCPSLPAPHRCALQPPCLLLVQPAVAAAACPRSSCSARCAANHHSCLAGRRRAPKLSPKLCSPPRPPPARAIPATPPGSITAATSSLATSLHCWISSLQRSKPPRPSGAQAAAERPAASRARRRWRTSRPSRCRPRGRGQLSPRGVKLPPRHRPATRQQCARLGAPSWPPTLA